MIMFTISEDNNITANASREEARPEAGSLSFDSQGTLAEVSADWPVSRFVEIWNSIPGNAEVSRFQDRKKAVARIWKAIQPLAGNAQPDSKGGKATKPVKKAKTTKKATPAKKADKGERVNKKAEVIAMMKRAKGATLPEIMEATGWQAHTVRGFVSILGSKGRQAIESSKDPSGERRYKIAK